MTPDRPSVDMKRSDVKAVSFDWDAAGNPEFGEPGFAGKFPFDDPKADHLQFACPGCGRFGAIRATHPKVEDKPSWDVVSGTLNDVTTLTLTPSVHCVGCCGWHGYLKNGFFQSC